MKNSLETERLFIRIETAAEYKHFFKTLDDKALREYFGLNNEELEVQKTKVNGGMTTYRMSFRMFHLIEKNSNKIIGDFAFHNWFPMHSRAEVGYGLRLEDYKNKGFMKEALPVIFKYGFEEMKLNRMEAIIGPNNIASQKLVLGNGFIQEAILKEHYCENGVIEDSLIFRLLHSEYKK